MAADIIGSRQMPQSNPLYALRAFAPGEYQMAKFSMPDFNVEAVYNLRQKGHSYTCDCPASFRAVKSKPCKHQRMMPYMLGAVNSDRFYEPESGRWINALPVELTKEGYDGAALAAGSVTGRLNGSGHLEEIEPPAAGPPKVAQAVEPPVVLRQPPAATPTIKRRI